MSPATAALVAIFWICAGALAAAELPPGVWCDPPALPPPTGTVVTVRAGDAADLQHRVRTAASETTVMVPAGTYRLSAPLRIGAATAVSDITVRGATGNRDDVIICGPGMRVDSSKTVPHCLMIENATDVLIADLSLGDVWHHPITVQAHLGAERPHIRNVRLFDAGEQFLKVNSPGDWPASGCDGGLVELCVFEYTTTARHWYTQGVDVHRGDDWIVRDNCFRFIRGPAGERNVGGAIDFWNGSRRPLIERNTIVDCAVGIRVGIVARPDFDDCAQATVRNNVIVRNPGAVAWADVGIICNDCPGARILHNTVILQGTYANAIEYRFPGTTDAVIRGNLLDAAIRARDGASAALGDNVTDASAELFRSITTGDARLKPNARAIDAMPPLATVTDDHQGHQRPIGARADIGADEWRATGGR